MKTIRRPVMAAFLLCGLPLALSVTTPAQAQRYGYDHPRRDDNRRPPRYERRDIDDLVKRVERNSNTFRDHYEAAERNRTLPPGDNGKLKDKIQRMDESLENLRSHFNSSNDWHTSKQQVQTVLDKARPVDRIVNNRPRIKEMFRPDWMKVRNELNRLATAYNLRPLS